MRPAHGTKIIGGSWVGVVIARLPTGRSSTGTAALCQLELGRRESADRAVALAEATATAVGLRIAEAWAERAAAAVALAEAGDDDRAAAEFERAAAQLEACGALRYRDAAERELRKLGRHIHRRTRRKTGEPSGLESLSERELQVARLIVDRKTNREIAAELFVSLKTVEAHIRNLFRKLDASSRPVIVRGGRAGLDRRRSVPARLKVPRRDEIPRSGQSVQLRRESARED
jgi:DNA-binding CsgD family transcriptional regulator